jgi:hypothetical protein
MDAMLAIIILTILRVIIPFGTLLLIGTLVERRTTRLA